MFLKKKIELTTNEKANLFIQIVINPNENYLHPKRKNVLITKSFGELRVNQNLYKSFFQHFEGDVYSPKEKEKLTSLVDRLIEDTTRRKKGEFFTPTPFVNLAHKYISDVYGNDWKERFIVWDCCAGTSNLTRDYKFKNLFISTLEQSDLDTANQMGYNPEAIKFQFDFLNDSDDKLPKELKNAIVTGKEILFLINPPYATANNMEKDGSHKGGVSNSIVGDKMRESKEWGASTQQLYAQFLYRIWCYRQINPNIHISCFTPPLYLTGGSNNKFRKKFFNSFGFRRGFLLQASHFSDTADSWGVLFSVIDNTSNLTKEFIVDVVDINKEYEIETLSNKNFYNTDNETKASDWVRKEIKGLKTYDAPQLTSALKIKLGGKSMCGRLTNNAIAYFFTQNNNVYENTSGVSLSSSCNANGHGLSIIKENILKVFNLFSARKLIKSNWINQKDEYLAPDEHHTLYEQFTYDSIVYSLFNNSSQQSSLRQIDYKDKRWDIKNEFFFMSKDDMLKLANDNSYDELYKDAKLSDERYVHELLFKHGIYDKLSDDAREILDMAIKLTKKSIQMRMLLSEQHPEYHLDSWDAGYAQLKLVWKEYFKDEFNTFRNKYKEMENRMRPLVYELGFLKK